MIEWVSNIWSKPLASWTLLDLGGLFALLCFAGIAIAILVVAVVLIWAFIAEAIEPWTGIEKSRERLGSSTKSAPDSAAKQPLTPSERRELERRKRLGYGNQPDDDRQ